MLRPTALAAAAAAVTVPLAFAAPALADQVPGDYKSFHTNVPAPRASIDVLDADHDSDASRGDTGGIETWFKVKDLRTVKESAKFRQKFVVVLNGPSMYRDYGFQRWVAVRGSGVHNVTTGETCAEATASFNDKTNKVRVFLPMECTTNVYAVQGVTGLVGVKDGRTYAADKTALWEY